MTHDPAILSQNCSTYTVGAGCLGSGLRGSFAGTARAWTSILLDKMKEKNTLLGATIVATLGTWVQHCVGLADVGEDFAAAAEHKHPKVKLDSLQLLQVWAAPT